MMERMRRSTCRLLWIAAVALIALPATAGAADDYPEDPAAALQHYESDVDDWGDGPAMWLMLDDEADLWDDLESTDDKQAFIAWFWDRRDPDLRDGDNSFQQLFYERVAESNSRYKGFPRGWKSDRGRLHVVLGAPDAESPATAANTEQLVWTWHTVGPQGEDAEFEGHEGELEVVLVRIPGEVGYEIYDSFGGAGAMPTYLQDALRFQKEAYVVNPGLQMEGMTS